MFKTYMIYFIIPVHNCVELLDDTMNGILEQTYQRNELRVLFVDNWSTDGSYEKIINYTIRYPELVSVYRMRKPTKRARMLKQASEYLRFSQVHFVMYLNPGDIVYPEFIHEAIRLFHFKPSINVVASNVDIKRCNGSVESQRQIFTDDCIIDKEVNYDLFFSAGIGSRVQCIFRGKPISYEERLVDIEKRIDFHSWIGLAFPKSGKVAVLNKSYGCAVEQKQDVVFDLMTKAYSLKSQFYLTETKEGKKVQERKLTDLSDMNAAYHSLAKNALYEAIAAGIFGEGDTVQKCLLISEMIYLPISETALYKSIKNCIDGKGHYSDLLEQTECITQKPPRDCFIF